jgi:hypothetical protein
MYEEEALMRKMELDYELLASGCCGMAGSFGFEKEKYQVSVACGERALLPEVRKASPSTVIMADGFSCKEQIAQQTERKGLHLAEVLDLALRNGNIATDVLPEETYVRPREQAIRKSMVRAGVITGAVAVGAILLVRALRNR